MSKKFIAVLVAIIIVVIGVVWLTSSNSANAPAGNGTPTNHVEGSDKYGIKLVEYGDYECPFCAEYYPIVKQVAAIYKDYIQVQFRNYPLTSIHQNAYAGARAAEAAALQNKFWQMHDLLYENNEYDQQAGWVVSQSPLNDYFISYAKQLKLNIPQFEKDYASEAVNDKIRADMSAFESTSYIDHDPNKIATPTYFLDGQHFQPTSISVDSFEQAINAKLKAKGVTPPKDATPSASSSSSSQPAGQSTEAQPKTKQ